MTPATPPAPGSDRVFAAIDLSWPAPPDDARVEQVLAELDDTHPTAIEETRLGVRVFFASDTERTRAAELAAIIAPDADVRPVDVPDEHWAERSQAMLTPVRVGRFVVTPPWHHVAVENTHTIIVQPSMGFGTGHHPSTRLCLRLLQSLALEKASALDVGTGSGVLAIAAAMLGAAPVVAVDVDADALESARENVQLNGLERDITTREWDLHLGSDALGRRFSVVLANLTGSMLQREAAVLANLVEPAGALIVSGFQSDEVDAVAGAFAAAGLQMIDRADEENWIAGTLAVRS